MVRLDKWSASKGHYKSQVPHTPDLAGRSHFLDLLAILIPALSCGLEFHVFSQHRPDNARVLVGHGYDRSVDTAPLTQSIDPPAERVGLARGHAHDGSGAVNQQGSQVLIAALADAHQDLSVPAGMLPWDKTHPGRQMSTVLELGTITK